MTALRLLLRMYGHANGDNVIDRLWHNHTLTMCCTTTTGNLQRGLGLPYQTASATTSRLDHDQELHHLVASHNQQSDPTTIATWQTRAIGAIENNAQVCHATSTTHCACD
jgi:hypothetical protein